MNGERSKQREGLEKIINSELGSELGGVIESFSETKKRARGFLDNYEELRKHFPNRVKIGIASVIYNKSETLSITLRFELYKHYSNTPEKEIIEYFEVDVKECCNSLLYNRMVERIKTENFSDS